MTASTCSSRFSARISGTPTCCTGRTGSSGCATWATRGPRLRSIQAVEHQALVALMAERAGVHVPLVDRVIKTPDGTVLLAMERIDGRALEPAPGAPDQRRAAAAIVGRGGPDAPGRDRAPVPPGDQRDDRRRRTALADRLQLFRAGRHPAAEGSRRGRAHGLAGHPGRPGSSGGERRCRRGRGGLAAAVPLLQPLALSAATRHAVAHREGLLAKTRVGGRHGQWPHRPGAGPDPAGTAPHPADDRRPRWRLLLHPPPAGPGREQLACHPVGAVGVGAGRHRHVGADLPGQRGLLARRRARTSAVLAHRPDPGVRHRSSTGYPRPTSAGWR